LTLLCGKPKLGKSWFLLSLLLAVSCGGVALGNVAVEQGEVLYISLEDNKKRLQKRANIVNQNRLVSKQFYYATEWPRLDEGGLDYLEEWIQEHPQCRLIGIDTWAKIKPRSRRSTSRQYEEDYEALTPLQELGFVRK
jgi:AAA domain